MSHVPRVVLLGRNAGVDTEKTHKILSSIEPLDIPGEFLYSIFVTTTNGTKYQVDKKTLKRGINYKDIDKSIRKLNIKDDIDVVEVVLDLAKIQSTLDRQSNEFLSKFFDN